MRAGGIRTRNATLAVHGSVLWGNRDDVSGLVDAQIFGFATVRYSCVEGSWGGDPTVDIGNIALDPRFANPAAGDLRLTPSSPCIDAGDNDALPPTATTDVLENPRRHDHPDTPDTGNGTAPIVDMGAYELDESMTAPGGGDGNGDGRLDGLDARAFLDSMTGPSGVASPSARHAFDSDHDRAVDMIDYLAFLGEIKPPDPSPPTPIDLRVTSGAEARVRVPTGTPVEYEVRAVLGDQTNLGLGAIVFDLIFTGGDLEPAALPSEMPMLGFVPLLGITNPGGFGGSPEGGVLLQADGSQNLWGTLPSVVPYPIGRVLEGVAHTEIVIARGTLRAPDVPGTYLADILNAAGATLEERPTVARDGLAPWTVGPLAARSLGSLEVEVVEPVFRRGDTNGDGRLDVSDPVATLGALFLGSDPIACLDAADANDDGATDISDAVAVLAYLFLGGREPPAPGPLACGPDPGADALDCGSYEACP